ncbi:MAG: hypothetical protein HW386_2595 [Gammaproteobacteria bacterium]|nr:hypothetical protein [Gammaproteobacteria bacterium]
MNKSRGYLILSLLLGIPPFAHADDIAKAAVEVGINASFSEVERQLIEKYFGKRVPVADSGAEAAAAPKPKGKKGNKDLPPGLAKKDKLPPGLEKQLQKNGTLPPGLAKRNLPPDLEQQLPPPPKGYERQIVEDATIVLVNIATGLIADVITDIVLGE